MTNYYKMFGNFVKDEDLKDGIPLDDFILKMKIYFGFGYNDTVKRWISNFETAGYLKVKKTKDNTWAVFFYEKHS